MSLTSDRTVKAHGNKATQVSCEHAFRKVAVMCSTALDDGMAEFLDTENESGPHRARVALRQLTTCLNAFEPILRRKQVRAFRSEAKSLFRALGKVRDNDVFVKDHANEPGYVDRAKANLALRKTIRKLLQKRRAARFSGTFAAAVRKNGAIYRRSANGKAFRRSSVVRLAQQVLDTAWARCLAYGPSLQAIPQGAMHDFRKDMKSLRYTAVFFSGQFPALAQTPFSTELRVIQDELGILNDYFVARRIVDGTEPTDLPQRQRVALKRAQKSWTRLSEAARPWR